LSYGSQIGGIGVVELPMLVAFFAVIVLAKYREERLQRQLRSLQNSRSIMQVALGLSEYMDDTELQDFTGAHDDALSSVSNVFSSISKSSSNVSKHTVHTTSTAVFFDLLHTMEADAGSLEILQELGFYEQWLIEPEVLQFSSDDEEGNVLGRGSFGQVRKATWHGKVVAVKESVNQPGDPRCFSNELRILRHVRHPNIALCLGACIDPATYSIRLVLEYVDGVTLDKFLESTGPRPNDTHRMHLLKGIAEGLRYLHERRPNVVHGDLKPSNIMVLPGGDDNEASPPQVKLLDFGLSRMLQGSVRAMGGTRGWSAPEVFAATSVSPSVATDMFSFGLIVYYVTTDREPQEVASPTSEEVDEEVFASHRSWAFNPMGKLGRSVAEKLLQKNPVERASAQNVHGDICNAIAAQEAAGSRRKKELAVPSKLETPKETLWRMLLATASSANVPVRSNVCCIYHEVINVLMIECRFLSRSPCSSVDFGAVESWWQCSTCRRMHWFCNAPHCVQPVGSCAECEPSARRELNIEL